MILYATNFGVHGFPMQKERARKRGLSAMMRSKRTVVRSALRQPQSARKRCQASVATAAYEAVAQRKAQHRHKHT